jgi:hypothetical protein
MHLPRWRAFQAAAHAEMTRRFEQRHASVLVAIAFFFAFTRV